MSLPRWAHRSRGFRGREKGVESDPHQRGGRSPRKGQENTCKVRERSSITCRCPAFGGDCFRRTAPTKDSRDRKLSGGEENRHSCAAGRHSTGFSRLDAQSSEDVFQIPLGRGQARSRFTTMGNTQITIRGQDGRALVAPIRTTARRFGTTADLWGSTRKPTSRG